MHKLHACKWEFRIWRDLHLYWPNVQIVTLIIGFMNTESQMFPIYQLGANFPPPHPLLFSFCFCYSCKGPLTKINIMNCWCNSLCFEWRVEWACIVFWNYEWRKKCRTLIILWQLSGSAVFFRTIKEASG